MLIQFVVDGKPVGKGRPKFTKRGDYVQAYTPEKTKAYEKTVRMAYKAVAGNDKGFMIGVPVSVRMRLFYAIPKGTSKKRKEMMMEGEIRPCVKPDIDNVSKCVLDALNGIAFYDDNQIVEMWVAKWYDEYPRVEVCISDV